MKKIILFLVLAVLVFGCPQPAEITNFEGCVAAGNPAMESYPRKCRAGDRTFTEVIAGVNSDIELSYSTGAAHLDWGTYYLEVGSDGKAMFTKSAGPGEKSYDFSVSAAELEKIYETAESEGFFFLQDNYTDPSIMDGGWSSITISGRGNSKTVGVTNYSLPAFEEVETEIARLILSKIGDDAFSLKDLEEAVRYLNP
ncbi:hypothetical protein KKH30_02670, partial [Candidatus Micrarchaeota archaeon]|nr:hypothetical protein [Candidatus Micrarchaeota archaeon]MBU1939642.1 hypothetical protein [Candidatus Micrarchaeota archaeon]